MDWSGHRVFVTGATGIVGSWLTKKLVAMNAYVVALVRDWDPQSELIRSGIIDRINVINGRLEDFEPVERAINEHEIDTVFHLGAQTIVGTALRSPVPNFEANIRGTYLLLDACRIHNDRVKRVVVASSDKAYGKAPSLPYNEEMPCDGRHPYDVSKSCADLLAMTYAHTYDLPVTVARCGNIYGGGDLNWSRIVPGTIRSALAGERPILRSDGTMIRDYIYVDDVVDAYVKLAEHTREDGIRGEAFNFSLESQVTVMQITRRILELMGRAESEPIVLNTARAEIQDQYLDSSKARKLLSWAPSFQLDEGIRHTIRWYENFLREQP